MMMVMPLLLMFVMPKLMNSQDPETQKVSSGGFLTVILYFHCYNI